MSGFQFKFPLGSQSLSGDAHEPGLGADAMGALQLCASRAEAVLQSLSMILATTPGERVLRPQFGSRLNELVYLPNDPTTAGLAIQYVREAIGRWEPRIILDFVDAGPDPSDHSRLLIWARYRLRGEASVREFELGLDLQGDTP